MIKAIKKGLLLGVGVAYLSKRVAEKKVNALAKQNIVTKKQAKELLVRVIAEAKVQKNKIEKLAEAEAKRQLKKVKEDSLKEIRQLKKRISVLEKKAKAKGRKTARKAAKRALKIIRKK